MTICPAEGIYPGRPPPPPSFPLRTEAGLGAEVSSEGTSQSTSEGTHLASERGGGALGLTPRAQADTLGGNLLREDPPPRLGCGGPLRASSEGFYPAPLEGRSAETQAVTRLGRHRHSETRTPHQIRTLDKSETQRKAVTAGLSGPVAQPGISPCTIDFTRPPLTERPSC